MDNLLTTMTTLVTGSDEAELLALVGGSVKDMSQYEEQIIQQAERSTAPLLTSNNSTNVNSFATSPILGFRSLVHALAPSLSQRKSRASNSTDLAHFQTVLARTRRELNSLTDESRRSQILRLKEQMILVYLSQKLNKDDVPIHVATELAGERQRKYQIQQQTTASMQESWKNSWNKPTSQNGTMSRNNTSATHEEQAGLQHPSRKRQRIQTLKKSLQLSRNEGDENNRVEWSKVLKQRRKQRQERRRQRLAQLLGTHEDDDDENDDEEVEFQEEEVIEIHGQDSMTQGKGRDIEHSKCDSKQEGNVEMHGLHQNQVECPLCHQMVPITSDETPDELLSRHIEKCQVSGRRLRHRQPKSYVDADDLKINEVDNMVVPRTRSSTRRNNKSTSINEPKRSTPPPLQATVAPALDDMEELVYEDRVDDWIENGLSKMKHMAERDKNEVLPGSVVYSNRLHVPAWINNRLFSYQRLGIRWMWDLHQQEAGGVVGDEMGLGKTVQVCAFLGCMAASRLLKSVLIVCPATMLRHWLSELATWAPGLRRILIHKSGETDGAARSVSPSMLKAMNQWLKKSRADRLFEPIDEDDFLENDEDTFVGTGYAFVTSYENLRRSPEVWTAHRWSYVVLDEGQKIRNPDSDITLVCKRLRTPHRLLLSGTPIQNDLKELWTLFDFVFPGRLGTLPTFETEFAEPIRRGGFSNASPMQVQLAYRCALVLKDLINPYLLRRQKKDIDEVSRMPGKTEQVLFCRLSKVQRRLYEAYLRSDEVMSVLRGSSQLFRSITILRKISNHPDLVCDPTDAAYEQFARNGINECLALSDSDDDEDDRGLSSFESLVERSGKLEILAKILPLWHQQGHRVLIFCQWTKMLNILQRFIMAQGWKFGRMDGKTSVASRQTLVDTFNSDESYFVLLMTTRTGGVGVNLTGANRVIIYDPDWNPQTDSQARARSHRFGQTKPVTIYRLITAGTIEEKIYHRQIFKTALTNRVLQDPKQKRLFSQRDLRDLFTLKADDGSVIQGGHGVTELGTITKGSGVIDPEAVARGKAFSDEDCNDDIQTLETVMKSKGLAGIFDHDFVDTSDKKKSLAVQEMEEKAKQVAYEAVKALKASASSQRDRFEPTFTGSEETSSGRFGHGGIIAKPLSSSLRQPDSDENFVGAGINRRNFPTAPSSKSLLAGLRSAMAPSTKGDVVLDSERSHYAALLKRIQSFIQRRGGNRPGGGPTTDDILKQFAEVASNEASIFRRLLTSVAQVNSGRWSLKDA